MMRKTMNGAVFIMRPSDLLTEKSHIARDSPWSSPQPQDCLNSRLCATGKGQVSTGEPRRSASDAQQHGKQRGGRRDRLDEQDTPADGPAAIEASDDDATQEEDPGRLAAAARPKAPGEAGDEERVIEPLIGRHDPALRGKGRRGAESPAAALGVPEQHFQ